MTKKKSTKPNAYDEFTQLRGELAAYRTHGALMAAEDPRQRGAARGAALEDLKKVYNDTEIARRIRSGETLDSIYGGLLTVAESNVGSQFTGKLDDIVADAPDAPFKEEQRIVRYDPVTGVNEKAQKAHKNLLDLTEKLKDESKHPELIEAGANALYDAKKKEYDATLAAKFKYAPKNERDAFATIGAQLALAEFNPKTYLAEVAKDASDAFRNAFASDSEREAYGRAALLATVKRLIKENKREEAQQYVDELRIPLKDLIKAAKR